MMWGSQGREHRRGLLLLAGVLWGVIPGWVIYLSVCKDAPHESDTPSVQQDLQDERGQEALSDAASSVDAPPAVQLFPFDPNTADSAALLKLGFTRRQVGYIYNYRAKGGVYSRPEQLMKLYTLTKGQYDRLAPYIRIADRFRPAADFYHSYSSTRDKVQVPVSRADEAASRKVARKLSPGQTLDINLADTTALMTIPGIGPYYARKIIAYRSRLGGFAHPHQVLEAAPRLDEQALDYCTCSVSPLLQLVQVNTLSLNQLTKHPYITFTQARAIHDYKRKYGRIKSLNTLQSFPEFTSHDLTRLAPYLSFE